MNDSNITAIVGMGRTGCAIARFLAGRENERCVGFDEHRVSLPDDINITVHTGSLKKAGLEQYGRIVVSPGIPWQHPALHAARQAGAWVSGDLDLFGEAFSGVLLAVTGTNGKTTTVSMINNLMEILPGGIDVGGNIGTPMLDMLAAGHTPVRAMLELSSFQLERCDRGIHPRWAALLNVQPDHADMHNSSADYEAAKLRLFEQQGKGDTAMIPADTRWHELAADLTGRDVCVRRFGVAREQTDMDAGVMQKNEATHVFWHQQGERMSIDCADIPLRGIHQHINLAVAAQAAADFGVPFTVIHEAFTSFHGLPHRLQWVGEYAGHQWFNDSKATNPDAAAAALASFDRVLWICGGARKGLDMASLTDVVKNHVAHAFIIGKQHKAFSTLLKAADIPFTVAGKMTRAVTMAGKHQDSLPVLLSPAAASQDQFHNYEERGRAFTDAASGLEAAA